MKRLRDFFSSKWVVGLIGLLALSLLIWFGADYIKFGSDNATLSPTIRIIIIAFIFALWLAWNLSQWLLERRQNQALIQGIEASQEVAQDPDEAHSREELDVLSGRFREAMDVLRNARFKSEKGRVSLYQLPWYVIIGPPGCGKTTALVNSGLEFPLAQSHGKAALGGVGGTRNCDWWFTNDAVLIDTAGRYTSQDSHRVYDNTAWQAFLGLLKRYRRRRPINGAVVAISLQDLMVQTEEQRQQQAKTIRQRVNELQRELGIRFPIYLTFTKCDLVAGFSEFFDNLSQAEREQVWGISFPREVDATTGARLDNFKSEFDQLIERLNQRVLWRVHQERNIEKRALLQGFPARMENLSGVLTEFVKQAFEPNRYETVPMVRGIYFTSGTQEGSPVDRMMASVTADFGLERNVGPRFQGAGKSFFLHRLLKDVVFPEAELVGVNRKIETANQWLRRGIYAALATVFVGAVFLWSGSLAQNTVSMGEVSDHLAAYQQAKNALRGKRPAPVNTLNMLEPLRQASAVYDRDAHPWIGNLGLYDERIDAEVGNLYRRKLEGVFLPALLRDIESDLSHLDSDDPALGNTLKTYLMFFHADRLDIGTIEGYYAARWERQLPGEAGEQEHLRYHLDQLLARPVPTSVEQNTRVVARARQQLRRIPVPQRLFAQLQNSDLGQTPVDLYQEIGGDTQHLFGMNANDARFRMPFLYTKAGYKELDFDADSPLLASMAKERWIYGSDLSGEDFTEADREKLGEEVKRIYLGEYLQRWQSFVGGFRIRQFKTTSQALEVLSNLSDPIYSPLLAVAEITSDNTRLTPRPELPVDASGVALPVSSTTRRVGGAALGSAAGALRDQYKPNIVDLHFEEVQRITQSEKGRPARVQEYLLAIHQIQEYLTEIDSAPDANEAAFARAKARFGGGGDAIKQLRIKAASAPAPFDRWLTDIANSTWGLVMAKAKAHLNRVWYERVYLSYANTLAGRYPLSSDRDREVPMMEFNQFFKPGGIQQSFVNEYLEPFVDTRNWRIKSVEGQALDLSQRALSQLRRAERIRKTLFAGSGTASYAFRIEPTKLDSSVRLFELELGDQRVLYSHGPKTSKKLTWRGGESNRVRIIFEDLNETVHRKHYEGDWAWYRLLASSDLAVGRSKAQRLVTFSENGRKAQFRLTAANVNNPFDRGMLRGYRCPEVL
ncbi:type VI secretion system membrane subunit TssM [Microbulbifer sp. 2205BS26-8]|uniref:type VI secretion system membrane subunit TssM n=1 Tax=Microbulbifer sp. 2205BS26-8 TaxID=3064386 RepID=UPI00273E6242|nr:type VI secretion system membrane subunit TssM [Microbulbifer sp. 2205BS26-8]MDP5208184.1 type VI secretion system membrane subunit TssM [Microbulbifer sp. 2205BS26-8]